MTRRQVVVNGRPLPDVTAEFYDALVEWNTAQTVPPVYARGGQLVRVRKDEKRRPVIDVLGIDGVRHYLTRAADPVRINKTKNDDRATTPAALGQDVIRNVLAAEAWPGVLPLEGIVEVPVLRPDGSVHQDAGYDQATALLHLPAHGRRVPPIPENPTLDQLAGAIDFVLDELLVDFPFETTADRANAVGMLLTPIVRSAVAGPTPLCVTEAPHPGVGKSLLAQVCARIATGAAGLVQPLPSTEEEIRKMLTSVLSAGSSVVVLDNIDETLRSPYLAAMLTAEEWTDRVLGRTEMVRLPNRAAWIATGNNIQVGGDLARRCYRVRLDAKMARPETRTGFRHEDLLGWVDDHRGELVAALLTMARAWWAAGQPPAPVPAMGTFTPWARTVGGILHHAGIDGFLGNLDAFREEADTDAAEWESFLAAWVATFGDRPVTSKAIGLELGRLDSPLTDAVPAALVDATAQQLGKRLAKRKGRRYGTAGYHIDKTKDLRTGAQVWWVSIDDPEAAGSLGVPGVLQPMCEEF